MVSDPRDYEIITTEQDFKQLENGLAEVRQQSYVDDLILNFETRPGHPQCEANDRFTAKIAGMAISLREGHAAYIPLDHDDGNVLRFNKIVDSTEQEVFRRLRPFLDGLVWANHNVRFDWGLAQMRNVNINYKWCSYVEAFLTGKYYHVFVNSGSMREYSDAGLKSLVLQIFGKVLNKIEDFAVRSDNQKIDIGWMSAEDAAVCACEGVDYSGRIHRFLHPQVNEMFLFKVEQALWCHVEDMEREGIPFNPETCQSQYQQLVEAVPKARDLILDQAERQLGYRPEVNLDSPKKCATFFYETLGLPCTVRSKKTKQPSTGKKAMANLAKAFDIVHNFLTYKQLTKADSGFLGTLPSYIHPITKKIHATFHQGGVPGGRFASSNPNMQNIPKIKTYVLKDAHSGGFQICLNIRDCFEVPEGDLLLVLDNAAVEFWVAAEISHETDVLNKMEAGWDVHVATATMIFHISAEQAKEVNPSTARTWRDDAKTRNYAAIFGETAEGMAEKLGIDIEEAAQHMDEYWSALPNMAAMRQKIISDAKRNMFVKTWFGRHVDLENLLTNPQRFMREHGERLAYNAVMQGTAADIAKIQFVRAGTFLKQHPEWNQVKIVHQGHDALAFHIHNARNFDLAGFYRIMKPLFEIPVPGFRLPVRVDCEVGKKYGSLVKYKGESHEELQAKIQTKEQPRTDSDGCEHNNGNGSGHENTEIQQNILVVPERPLTKEDLIAFKGLLTAKPGINVVHLSLNGNGHIYSCTNLQTSLTLADSAKFNMILPCKVVAHNPQEILTAVAKTVH